MKHREYDTMMDELHRLPDERYSERKEENIKKQEEPKIVDETEAKSAGAEVIRFGASQRKGNNNECHLKQSS